MSTSRGFYVTGDVKKLTKRINKIQKKIVPRATVSALNKHAAAAVSKSRRASSDALGVKLKALKTRIRLDKHNRATTKRPAAIVTIDPSDINAASFLTANRFSTLVRKTHGPIKKRPKSIKAYGRHVYEKAFVGHGLGGTKLIMTRKGSGDSAVIIAKKIQHKNTSRTSVRRNLFNRAKFREEFNKQLSWRLKK